MPDQPSSNFQDAVRTMDLEQIRRILALVKLHLRNWGDVPTAEQIQTQLQASQRQE